MAEPPLLKPWEQLAAHWSRLGPPLRPSPEDAGRLRAAWLGSFPHGIPDRKIDILLLGVTPEFALFPWAPQAHLTAIDSSESMIRAVWPGNSEDREAVLGDWLSTPFADAGFDLILTDGGFVVAGSFERLRKLGRELHRLTRPGGRVVVRQFIRARPERPEALPQAVADGAICDFNELKLRLLTALPGEGEDRSVSLPSALEYFDRLFPDRAALARRLGCPAEIIATIDMYRGQTSRYIFPAKEDIARCLPDFCVSEGPCGSYPGAEWCPVFTLSPKP